MSGRSDKTLILGLTCSKEQGPFRSLSYLDCGQGFLPFLWPNFVHNLWQITVIKKFVMKVATKQKHLRQHEHVVKLLHFWLRSFYTFEILCKSVSMLFRSQGHQYQWSDLLAFVFIKLFSLYCRNLRWLKTHTTDKIMVLKSTSIFFQKIVNGEAILQNVSSLIPMPCLYTVELGNNDNSLSFLKVSLQQGLSLFP